MKLRMKVYPCAEGWFVVNSAYQRSGEAELTVLLSGERDRHIEVRMAQKHYDALEYRWFEDAGAASSAPRRKEIAPIRIESVSETQ